MLIHSLEQALCQHPKICQLFSRGAGLRGGLLSGHVRKMSVNPDIYRT